MTQRDLKLNEVELSDMFEAARSSSLTVSDSFMATLMADADAELVAQGAGLPNWAQAPNEQAQQDQAEQDTVSFAERVLNFLGGWRGATGLATATVTGLVIGLGAPSTVLDVTDGYWASASAQDTVATVSYALDDLVPSFYDLAVEG